MLPACAAALVLGLSASQALAGSIFLTGHDPDFHAVGAGSHAVGAQHINQIAIGYVSDPNFNPFTANGVSKFLYVQSNIAIPGGHRDGVVGLVDSGFVNGVDFEEHDASTLVGELALLGTKYNAIVVASDFGALLTSAELDLLNTNSQTIIDFINDGGGVYAMAQSNLGAGLTPNLGHFGFLPFVVSSTGFNQDESGNQLTQFGMDLGLVLSDVTSNFSHNIFDDDFGLNVVDFDRLGQILTLAGRPDVVTPGGVVPEPSTYALFGLGLGLIALRRRRKRARSNSAD